MTRFGHSQFIGAVVATGEDGKNRIEFSDALVAISTAEYNANRREYDNAFRRGDLVKVTLEESE